MINTKSGGKKNILVTICVIEALIILASILFLITIDNNNKSDNTLSYEEPAAPYEDMAFEDAIRESNLIIEGVFIGQHEKDGYYELEFAVKNDYFGNYNDQTIMVYVTPDTEFLDSDTFYILDYDQFKEDETYILFLQRVVSVYYDNDRYVPIGEIVYPKNDPEAATMFGEPIDSAAHQLINQLSSANTNSRLTMEINAVNDYVGVDYTDAVNLGDIAKYAEYALKVKISEYVYNNESLGTTAYTCEVLDSYSGVITGNMIIVNFFNDTVVLGEEYIVFLNKAGEDSIVYALASKENSVLAATEHNINAVIFNISISLLRESTAPIPFTDIGLYEWYYDSVAYVFGVGLMNGTSEILFSPLDYITREDVVVILGRLDELLGHTRSIHSAPFTDVTNPATYYHRYVGWAYTNGIVNGISDTEFGVGLPLTRQDFCAMLYRYADFDETGINLTGSISFLDAEKISSYATAAVSGCANGGIINGYEDGTFKPHDNIKRDEVAHVITKYIQLYIN